jgi:hypothetical protein
VLELDQWTPELLLLASFGEGAGRLHAKEAGGCDVDSNRPTTRPLTVDAVVGLRTDEGDTGGERLQRTAACHGRSSGR